MNDVCAHCGANPAPGVAFIDGKRYCRLEDDLQDCYGEVMGFQAKIMLGVDQKDETG